MTGFLTYIIGNALPEAKAARMTAVGAEEWSVLLFEAERHGLAPLLYRRIGSTGAQDAVPAQDWGRLRTLYLKSLARNMKIFHEVKNLLRLLADAGVPVIALKGAYLAECVYGDIALRPMGDVDLLVPKDRLAHARKAMMDGGYREQMEGGYSGIEVVCEISNHLFPLIGPGGLAVEIHWTIENPTVPFRIDVDGLWERATPVRVGGVGISGLSPEDLVLHLCLHAAAHHGFENGFRGICDLHQAIEVYEGAFEWSEMVGRSKSWGVERSISLPLHLAGKWFGTEIPGGIAEEFTSHADFAEMVAISERLLCRQAPGVPVSDNITRLWGDYKTAEKIHHLMKRLFPTKSEIAATYPVPADSAMIYAYYVLRLKDLVGRHGAGVMDRCLPGKSGKEGLARGVERNRLKDWLFAPS